MQKKTKKNQKQKQNLLSTDMKELTTGIISHRKLLLGDCFLQFFLLLLQESTLLLHESTCSK